MTYDHWILKQHTPEQEEGVADKTSNEKQDRKHSKSDLCTAIISDILEELGQLEEDTSIEFRVENNYYFLTSSGTSDISCAIKMSVPICTPLTT